MTMMMRKFNLNPGNLKMKKIKLMSFKAMIFKTYFNFNKIKMCLCTTQKVIAMKNSQ